MSTSISQTMKVLKNINCPWEVTIGNNLYLIEKDFLGVHRQTLYSSEFKREREFINGRGTHFEYDGMFNTKGRLMEVGIEYYICYGPLGDRLNINVKLDRELVGDYRSLRSYCGAGSNGKWPNIKDRNSQIVFKLEQSREPEAINKFSIDYYENLFPSLKQNDSSEDLVNIGYDNNIIRKEYGFDEIQQYKQTVWELSVIDNISGDNLGVLSYCEYPGFKWYNCSVYGSFKGNEWFFLKKEPWIGSSEKGKWLSTIEINQLGCIEREILSGKCQMSITKEEFKRYAGMK